MTQGRSRTVGGTAAAGLRNLGQGPGCGGHTLRRWLRRGVGHPISAGYNGPVSPARGEGCANLRWRAGRFRRTVLRVDMPLSDSVAVLASRETDTAVCRPAPRMRRRKHWGLLLILWRGASASADAQDRHTGVCARPTVRTIAAAAVLRQIRGHICIPKLLRKAARECGVKASLCLDIAACGGMPQCQILLYCQPSPASGRG